MYVKVLDIKNNYIQYAILWGKPQDELKDLEFSREVNKVCIFNKLYRKYKE